MLGNAPEATSATSVKNLGALLKQVVHYAVVFVVGIELIHLLASFQFPALFTQITLPYAVNGWSDGPLLVQIDRIFRGFSPYAPVFNADSFTYGPVYLYVLAAIDRLRESVPLVAHLRVISVAIGALSAVPVALTLFALQREGTRYWASALAWGFTLVSYLFVASRDPLFVTLHPDTLTLLLIATAIACVFWYPTSKRKLLIIGILLGSCFLDALTKFNSAPQALFFLAALVFFGSLRVRAAIVALGAYLAALGLFYLIVPKTLREWTLIIPAHHPSRDLISTINDLISQWHGEQPWQGVLVVTTVALLGWQIWRRDRPQGTAWTLILGGLFLTGLIAKMKFGGGAYDLWWFYAACTIPIGAELERAMRTLNMSATSRLPLQIAAVAYVLALGSTINLGLFVRVPIDAAGRAELASTGAALARLCRPGYHIMVTWYPDPLLRCRGATFQFWDSVEEITWARLRGYKEQTVMDGPISPDAFVLVRELWPANFQPRWLFPLNLVGNYRVVTLPVYEPSAYFPDRIHLDVFLKRTSYR